MRSVPHLALVGLVLPLFCAGLAMAQGPSSCLRPPQPACAIADVTFLSADAMTACQGVVQDYLAAMPEYQECLRQGQLSGTAANAAQVQAWREEQQSAAEELIETARYFNCRLMGHGDCK